jgi:trimeric autotransporter adhesin
VDRPDWSQLLQHSFWESSAPATVAMPQQPVFEAAVAAQRLATKQTAIASVKALSARTTAATASSSSGSNSVQQQQQQQQQQRTPHRSDAAAAVTPAAAAVTATATKQRVSSAEARTVSKSRKPGSSSSSSNARRAHREADRHMHSSSSASDGDKDTELVRCSHNAVAVAPAAAAVAAAAPVTAVVRASAELHGTTEYEEDFELDDSCDNNTANRHAAVDAHSDDGDLAAAFTASFDRALSTGKAAAATAGAATAGAGAVTAAGAQRSSPHTSSSAKQSARALNFEPITGERSASSRSGSSAKSRTSIAAAAAATTATSALRASTAWSSEQRAATPDTDRSAAATAAVTAATVRPTDATGSRDADSADVLWIEHAAAQSPPIVSAHSLLLHASDARVKPIVGNTDMEPAASATPQFTAALLPFRALPSATVEAMSQQQAEQFLSSIYAALLECPAATRAHVAGYLITVAAAPATATLLVNSTFVPLFVQLLLGTQHQQQQQQQQQQHSRTSSSKQQSTTAASPQLKRRLTALLALTVRHASYIAADTILGTDSTDAVHDSGSSGSSGSSSSSTGLLAAFVRLLEERTEPAAATDVLVRRKAVAALGELLFYMATQGGQPGMSTVT